MWGIIATWEMAYAGVKKASDLLRESGNILDAVEECVKDVEENEEFTSVGYGGLPNEECEVELDASFMDGNTLSIGAVASIRDFLNPSSIARTLMNGKFNNFLVGSGAGKYALNQGFTRQNMLTEKSKIRWQDHKKDISDGLSAYIGHDTVCAVGIDSKKNMATCTSTSGLFFKKAGRVGDSPIPGSGFYVDSEVGGASATGLGEDIMKGCLSFEIVNLMKSGLTPQEACDEATLSLHNKLTLKRGKAGDISVIAMNNKGEFGASTNISEFPFVVATDKLEVTTYVARFNGKTTVIEEM